jgi:hypothetical protein
MNDAQRIRLALREHGYSPLPIAPNSKRPALKEWQTKTEVSVEEILTWSDGGTGILTATTPVLDVDVTDEAAVEVILEFVAGWFADSDGEVLCRQGRAPRCAVPFRAQAPFKKRSATFKAPNGELHTLEFLGSGQQCVVSGPHPDTGKPYHWRNDRCLHQFRHTDLPEITEVQADRLIDQLGDRLEKEFGWQRQKTNGTKNGHAAGDGPTDLAALLRGMNKGNRHNTQLKASAVLLNKGLPADVVTDLLVATTKCNVGEPANDLGTWAEEERIIKHMCGDWFKKKPELISKPEPITPPADDYALPPGWGTYDPADINPQSWIIKGLLPERGVMILPGQWGMFKSTVSLELSYCIMSGQPFANHYRVKKPGAVMLYVLEGKEMVSRRLHAVTLNAGGDPRVVPPIFWNHTKDVDGVEKEPEPLPPLTHPDAAAKFIAMAKMCDAHAKHFHGVPLRMIWIDTYVACAGHTASGDDNDRAATQRAFNTLRRISEATGILVAVVDHFGKNADLGTVGSSGKEQNADCVIASLGSRDISGAMEDLRLVVRKQRDGKSGVEMPFSPIEVDVGVDDDGEAVTAIALKIEKPRAAQPARRQTENDDLFSRAVEIAINEHGTPIELDSGNLIAGVCESDLKKAFHAIFTRRDTETDQQYQSRRSMAFSRGLTRALSSGQLTKRPSDGLLYRTADANKNGGFPPN